MNKERVIEFFKNEWQESLAKLIWEDLTPLGRVVLFLPLWLMCLAALPAVFLGAVAIWLIAAPFEWVFDRFPKIPPIFFR